MRWHKRPRAAPAAPPCSVAVPRDVRVKKQVTGSSGTTRGGTKAAEQRGCPWFTSPWLGRWRRLRGLPGVTLIPTSSRPPGLLPGGAVWLRASCRGHRPAAPALPLGVMLGMRLSSASPAVLPSETASAAGSKCLELLEEDSIISQTWRKAVVRGTSCVFFASCVLAMIYQQTIFP